MQHTKSLRPALFSSLALLRHGRRTPVQVPMWLQFQAPAIHLSAVHGQNRTYAIFRTRLEKIPADVAVKAAPPRLPPIVQQLQTQVLKMAALQEQQDYTQVLEQVNESIQFLIANYRYFSSNDNGNTNKENFVDEEDEEDDDNPFNLSRKEKPMSNSDPNAEEDAELSMMDEEDRALDALEQQILGDEADDDKPMTLAQMKQLNEIRERKALARERRLKIELEQRQQQQQEQANLKQKQNEQAHQEKQQTQQQSKSEITSNDSDSENRPILYDVLAFEKPTLEQHIQLLKSMIHVFKANALLLQSREQRKDNFLFEAENALKTALNNCNFNPFVHLTMAEIMYQYQKDYFTTIKQVKTGMTLLTRFKVMFPYYYHQNQQQYSEDNVQLNEKQQQQANLQSMATTSMGTHRLHQYFYYLAQSLKQMEFATEAIEAYSTAIAENIAAMKKSQLKEEDKNLLQTQLYEMYLNRSKCLLVDEQIFSVMRDLNSAIEQNPNRYEAYLQRLVAYHVLGTTNMSAVEQDYTKCMTLMKEQQELQQQQNAIDNNAKITDQQIEDLQFLYNELKQQ